MTRWMVVTLLGTGTKKGKWDWGEAASGWDRLSLDYLWYTLHIKWVGGQVGVWSSIDMVGRSTFIHKYLLSASHCSRYWVSAFHSNEGSSAYSCECLHGGLNKEISWRDGE